MAINWLSYVVVIVITTFIVSIITENVVMDRVVLDRGVQMVAGRCRLKEGYGLITVHSQGSNNSHSLAYSNSLLEQETMINELQKDIKTLIYRLEAAGEAEQRKIDHPEDGFRNISTNRGVFQ
jgi:hypothetical protein